MNLAENVPDEPLGVHIEKIIPDGNAAQCGVLKCGFILREVCGKDAMEMEFDDIMDILREAPFDAPLKMIFMDPMKTEDGEDIEEGEGEGEDVERMGEGEDEVEEERRSFSFEDFDGEGEGESQGEGGMGEGWGGRRPILLRRKSSLT
jgi:hypothetical protein